MNSPWIHHPMPRKPMAPPPMPGPPLGPPEQGDNSDGLDTFLFTQKTPSDHWVIQHNLGTRRPLVFIYDSDGQPVNAAWSVVDKDTIEITPAVAFVGMAAVYKTEESENEPVALNAPILFMYERETNFIVGYELPEGSVGIIIQYDTSEDFSNPKSLECYGAGLIEEPFEGTYYFRGQSQGMTSATLDSEWSEPISVTFDSPTDVAYSDNDGLTIIKGTNVRLADFCSLLGSDRSIHYRILDDDTGEEVLYYGEADDIPSEELDIGYYSIEYYVELDHPRSVSVPMKLFVSPTPLPAPVISVVSVTGQSVKLGGIVSNAATGWMLKVDGGVPTDIEPTVDGYYTVTGLSDLTKHTFSVKAISDNLNFGDSPWSEEVSAVTTSGLFKITTDYYAADRRKIRQNCVFCARIVDGETKTPLDPSSVTGIKLDVFKQSPFGGRNPVEDFTDVEVPLSALYAEVKPSAYWHRDPFGCNFIFVPDQTEAFIFDERGVYDVEITISVSGGNPIVARWQLNVL